MRDAQLRLQQANAWKRNLAELTADAAKEKKAAQAEVREAKMNLPKPKRSTNVKNVSGMGFPVVHLG